MTPEEFQDTAASLCGDRVWKRVVQHNLEVNVSTVNRWASGYTPISRANELAIQKLFEHTIELRDSIRKIIVEHGIATRLTADDIRGRIPELSLKNGRYIIELIDEVRRSFVETIDLLQQHGALKEGVSELFRNERVSAKWNH